MGPSGCILVPPAAARIRLDRYLSERFPDQSRSQIQGLIRNGHIRVNQTTVKTGHLLQPGDTIEIEVVKASTELQPRPENIPLHLVYEDEDLAVVDKPAGLVCHMGSGVRTGTLVNALLYHLGPLQTGDVLRPGIVHRLDKLTSGLLVIAKNLESHRALADQFKARRVKKEYLALVYGHPHPEDGTIDLPLGRDLRDRKKISVRAHRRRDAVTHYHEESKCGPFSLLRVRIETGRTHQIRVHLAQLGYPVVGDTLYGGNRFRNLTDPNLRTAARELNRQFLHAARLEFRHPRTQELLAFTAPLPQELSNFLNLAAHDDAGRRGARGKLP